MMLCFTATLRPRRPPCPLPLPRACGACASRLPSPAPRAGASPLLPCTSGSTPFAPAPRSCVSGTRLLSRIALSSPTVTSCSTSYSNSYIDIRIRDAAPATACRCIESRSQLAPVYPAPVDLDPARGVVDAERPRVHVSRKPILNSFKKCAGRGHMSRSSTNVTKLEPKHSKMQGMCLSV